MQNLHELNKLIYNDIVNENKKQYRNYADQLTKLLIHEKDNPQNRRLFGIAFYNLAKLSNRFRYLHSALQFMDSGIDKTKYNLQMLALVSSKGSHSQAYSQACKLITHILTQIQQLKLNKQLQMFARQLHQLIHRPKSVNVYSATSLNELQMTRKFQTNCVYVNKKFHIADIMIMEPIDPSLPEQSPQLKDQEIFFYYIVFLSIACFTRATQRFYCRESTDRDFHYKAIQIAGYLYFDKSTYLRFLKRTYKQHYLEHLDQIEEVDQYGELRVPVLVDPDEVSMMKMPWQEQKQIQQVQQFQQTIRIQPQTMYENQGEQQGQLRRSIYNVKDPQQIKQPQHQHEHQHQHQQQQFQNLMQPKYPKQIKQPQPVLTNSQNKQHINQIQNHRQLQQVGSSKNDKQNKVLQEFVSIKSTLSNEFKQTQKDEESIQNMYEKQIQQGDVLQQKQKQMAQLKQTNLNNQQVTQLETIISN